MPEQEEATNVRTGETVTAEVPTPDEAYIASLRRERAAYAMYGREDRVAAVDAELERWGVAAEPEEAEQSQAAPKETAAESKPRRTARGK